MEPNFTTIFTNINMNIFTIINMNNAFIIFLDNYNDNFFKII
jgi:hypothetical protein